MLTSLSMPELSEIADGSFFRQVSAFYSDRFPLRRGFLAIKTGVELLLGKTESNGVIFAEEGYLVPRCDYESLDTARKNLEFFSELRRTAESEGKGFYCAVAPRSIDVMTEALPPYYSGDDGEIWRLFEENIEYLDLTEGLRKGASEGEYLWYRTDHHWTTQGAYVAYCDIADAMGISPYPVEFFERQRVSEDFLGTAHSKAGGYFGAADSLELFRYGGDEAFTVTVEESGESFCGFYRMERLDTKDKYSVFLGGNYPRLTVTAGCGEDGGDVDVERKRLLLIKDSYANALIPFLALHYDLDVVDARYFNGDISPLISAADTVLLLHGADTVATTLLCRNAYSASLRVTNIRS